MAKAIQAEKSKTQIRILRRKVRKDMQELRLHTIEVLEKLLGQAQNFAEGKIQTQVDDTTGAQEEIDNDSRRAWMEAAVKISQAITKVAGEFDDKQIDKDLQELEETITKAKQLAQATKKDAREKLDAIKTETFVPGSSAGCTSTESNSST